MRTSTFLLMAQSLPQNKIDIQYTQDIYARELVIDFIGATVCDRDPLPIMSLSWFSID